MQIEDSQMMVPEIAPRVRECMQQSIEMTKELCDQVVSFIRDTEQNLTLNNLENISPLVLQCIYTCASNMSWMAVETGNPHYTESKSVCEDMLHTVSRRWEVAGKFVYIWASSMEIPCPGLIASSSRCLLGDARRSRFCTK